MAAYLYHMQVYMYLDKYHGFGKKNKFEPTNVVEKFAIVFLVSTIATLCIEEPFRNYWKKTEKPAVNYQSILPQQQLG